jgi:hypothetical protein
MCCILLYFEVALGHYTQNGEGTGRNFKNSNSTRNEGYSTGKLRNTLGKFAKDHTRLNIRKQYDNFYAMMIMQFNLCIYNVVTL